MAITHASPGQIIDISPLGEQLAESKTVALFKSNDIEVIRLVLLAGKSFPPHTVSGEVTIQCIEGVMSVSASGIDSILRIGQLIYLQGNVLHSVNALENASALITIALVK
jgi:quercetin dioxygenase-like cupin family protein